MSRMSSETAPKIQTRIGTFALLSIASWCVMTTTHELGHIVVGLACGGTLVHADIVPWHPPHSMFDPDPYPLLTLWGGPILGVALPNLFAWLLRKSWAWFVADFCTLANGCYISLAWLTGDSYLDTTRLLNEGASLWSVVLYCFLTIGFGYFAFRRDCIEVLSARSNLSPKAAE